MHAIALYFGARQRSAGANTLAKLSVAPLAASASLAALPAPLEHGMLGNDDAAINDADQVRQLLDFDDPAGSVGNAVKVAANRDEAIMGMTGPH